MFYNTKYILYILNEKLLNKCIHFIIFNDSISIFFNQMATVEITAYGRPPSRGDMATIIDGRKKRLKIGKTMRRTSPIPVLPPRIPTPMPNLPKDR